MINRQFTYIILSLLIVFIVPVNGQNIKYISVDEALELAKQNNASTKIAEWDQRISNASYKQTDATFLPQVYLGYTAISTNNPLNAFGFVLNQATVTAANFDPAKLNDPGSTQNYNASVEIRQPIINLDMIFARKGAKYQEEVYKYKTTRTRQYVDFEVKKAYSQLQFSYKAEFVLQNSLEKVKQIHRTVDNFYNEGLVQKSDVLNAQVQVNAMESALAKAQSNIYNSSDGLELFMGVESDNIYKTDSLIEKSEMANKYNFSSSRADIMAMNKALDATNMMIKSAKMGFLPKLNAFGTYQLNDSKSFRFNSDSYLVGISLSWNIFSGNQNRNKVKSYQYQRNKLQIEKDFYVKQGQLELDKARRDLSDLQKEISKQKSSVEQATEALRILENRYKEGLVSTTDLLMSQTQLSQQELLLAQAIMSHNITIAYLEFLSEIN